MKTMKQILMVTIVASMINTNGLAQNVGISDDGNSFTPNSTSVLELKSTSKGILIPRMTNSDRVAISSPATGLMVYQTDGNAGFWFYNGTQWTKIGTEDANPVSKTVSCTLTTNETLVLASNDITITLPAISSANNGLAITIKNVGSYKDLIVIQPNSGSYIDSKNSTKLYRWESKTFLAVNGEWMIKEKDLSPENVFDVSPNGSWTTLDEIIEFLDEHMSNASIVRLNSGTYSISSTITIDLPYSLTIEGISYGSAIIQSASGLDDQPMFVCESECYFKMLTFDGSGLSGYGSSVNEDAIHFNGSGTYNEVKDCVFSTFYRGITVTTDAELWIFETDFEDMTFAGIQIKSSTSGTTFKISECDFMNCRRGLELNKGSEITASIMNCGFYNEQGTDTAVTYYGGNISFSDLFFTNNTWNYTGKFFEGYDFTRSDGRDANIKILNNSGIEDQNPKCKINVNNNTSATNISNSGTWYKAQWTNTSYLTCKFAVNNNRITYQPNNKMYGMFIITGNISVSSTSRIISIGLVKNGNTGVRYGECDLRPSAAGSPMQFATVIYVGDISQKDYFELYCAANGSCTVTFQDVQWFTVTY